LNALLDLSVVLMISTPPQVVRSGVSEHVRGAVEVVEAKLDLQLQVPASLLVAPPAEGHLEAARVVE
jgi:hypothetical protein